MFESKFKKISEKYDLHYKKTEFKVNSNLGSKMPVTIHNFELTHCSEEIKIVYEFGNSNVAVVNVEISNNKIIPNLEITTRDQLLRLLSFNKNPWKLKSKDNIFSKKTINLLGHSGLTELAKNKAFEPTIIGNYFKGNYKLNTKFYLGFDNKEDSLVPVINFYKDFIQFIKESY